MISIHQYRSEADTDNPKETDGFSIWSGGSDIIEPEDLHAVSFHDRGPFVFRCFHGTTWDFTVFDPSKNGTPEGHFGRVNYFSTDLNDSARNYLENGCDITNRVARECEKLVEDIELDPSTYDLDIDAEIETIESLARELAESRLLGGTPHVKEVLVRLDRPFVVGTDTHRLFIEGVGDLHEKATCLLAEELGISPDGIDYEAHEERIWEIREELEFYEENPFLEAFRAACLDLGFEAGQEMEACFMDLHEGVSHNHFERIFREEESILFAEDFETGDVISCDLLSRTLYHLGFDGIVLLNAEKRFRGMVMKPDTAHVHVFPEYASSIKSAHGNNGGFSRTSPDIHH